MGTKSGSWSAPTTFTGCCEGLGNKSFIRFSSTYTYLGVRYRLQGNHAARGPLISLICLEDNKIFWAFIIAPNEIKSRHVDIHNNAISRYNIRSRLAGQAVRKTRCIGLPFCRVVIWSLCRRTSGSIKRSRTFYWGPFCIQPRQGMYKHVCCVSSTLGLVRECLKSAADLNKPSNLYIPTCHYRNCHSRSRQIYHQFDILLSPLPNLRVFDVQVDFYYWLTLYFVVIEGDIDTVKYLAPPGETLGANSQKLYPLWRKIYR